MKYLWLNTLGWPIIIEMFEIKSDIHYKGDSRIFLWRSLSSLHSKAAIGSFLLGGSGGMLPQKNLKIGVS